MPPLNPHDEPHAVYWVVLVDAAVGRADRTIGVQQLAHDYAKDVIQRDPSARVEIHRFEVYVEPI